MQNTSLLLRIGILAALLSCLADILLLYVPEGGYESGDYGFFFNIPPFRLLLGHYGGIFIIPLQLLGFVAVRKALMPAGRTWVNAISGLTVFLTVAGVAYHGQLGLFANFMQQLNIGVKKAQLVAGLQNCYPFFEPLAAVLMFLYAILSFLLAYTVAYKPTAYPRRAALGNPLAVYLVIILFYVVNKPIGGLFMVAGINFSIFIWLLLTLLYADNDEINKQ